MQTVLQLNVKRNELEDVVKDSEIGAMMTIPIKMMRTMMPNINHHSVHVENPKKKMIKHSLNFVIFTIYYDFVNTSFAITNFMQFMLRHVVIMGIYNFYIMNAT